MDLYARLSNPWVPYVLLGTGVLVTLSTLFVQVRTIPAAIRAWRQPSARAGLFVLFAGAAGLGSTTAAAAAVAVGGPGALVWMWIATLLGAALHHGEASLQARVAPEPGGAFTPYLAEHTGALGRPLATFFALASIVLAILGGGLLQGQQAAALVPEPRGLVTVGVAALALWIAFASRVRASFLGVVVPLALAVYVTFGLVIALRDPLRVQLLLGDAFNQAFGLRPGGAGLGATLIAVSLHHGVLRAMLAGQLGLGTGSLAALGPRAAPGAILVPLVTGGVASTVTALLVLTTAANPEPVADARIVPLEQVHSRGLKPNRDVGQVVVLPDDTTLEAGKVYGMLMRSNPRGHRVGKLVAEENAVIVPAWTVTAETDTIVFRSRDPLRKDQPGWDVRIECTRELVGEGAQQVLKLVPKQADLQLKKLVAYYELDPQPYVTLSDFVFPGRVEEAMARDALGRHLAMFEAPDGDRPFVPKLHEFVRFGFRGPYAVAPPGSPDAEARPPWAFVAHEGVTPAVGGAVPLRIVGNPRGDDLVRLNRVGGVEAPPWALFMRVRYLVVRHELDPERDLWIRVRPEHDGFRVRLRAEDPAWKDFRRVAKMEGYTGPFVYVGDQPFEAEVHGDVRLGPALAGRRALIPLDVPSEPMGPEGPSLTHPHPAELVQAGMAGPVLHHEGIALVVTAFDRLPFGRPLVQVLGLVLAIAGLVGWSHHAERAATYLFGTGQGHAVVRAIAIVVIVAAVGGPLLTFDALLGWVDIAMIAAALPNLLALALRLPGVRRA